MSVKIEPNGRRSVQVETEIPGTPEQVWEAIATGPGVTAWFVPTRVENGEDGKPARIIMDMGPGMESVAKTTAWDPPRRFAAESNGLGPEAPTFATEWVVEAKDGDTCTVRVIHSFFTESSNWDNELEGTETGWPGFFTVLRLYLRHFAGKPCTNIQLMGQCPGDPAASWQAIADSLGVQDATVGASVKSPSGTPTLSGVVEGVAPHRVVVRTEDDVPKVIIFAVHPCTGMNLIFVSAYLYGEAAADLATSFRADWQEWLARFAAAS